MAWSGALWRADDGVAGVTVVATTIVCVIASVFLYLYLRAAAELKRARKRADAEGKRAAALEARFAQKEQASA